MPSEKRLLSTDASAKSHADEVNRKARKLNRESDKEKTMNRLYEMR